MDINWDSVTVPSDAHRLWEDLPFGLDIYSGPLDMVLDIGAHVGLFSLCAAKRGAKNVLAIEAAFSNFVYLAGNIASTSTASVITPVYAAVAPETFQRAELRYGGMLAQYSTHYQERLPIAWTPLTVGFSDLVKFCCGFSGVIDYVKMDIEGGEWAIFNFKNELLGTAMRKIRYFQIDTHPDVPNPWFSGSDASIETLDAFMEQIGFCCVVKNGPCKENRQYKNKQL